MACYNACFRRISLSLSIAQLVLHLCPAGLDLHRISNHRHMARPLELGYFRSRIEREWCEYSAAWQSDYTQTGNHRNVRTSYPLIAHAYFAEIE
jgi:hypothetical protein